MMADSSGNAQANTPRRRKWPWILILLILLFILLNYRYHLYPWPWGAPTPKVSSIGGVSDVSEPAEATPPAPEKKIKPQPATKKPAGKEGESEATRVIDYAQIKKDTPKSPEEIEAPSKPAVRVKAETIEDQEQPARKHPAEEEAAADLQPDEAAPPVSEQVTERPLRKNVAEAKTVKPAVKVKAETIEDQEQAAEEIGPADLQPEQAENTVPPLNEQATEKPLRKNVAEAKTVKPAGKPVEKPAPAAEKQEKPDQLPDQRAQKENQSPATSGTGKTASEEQTGELVRQRKEIFGLEQSVDMVVKPDEAIRIGQETVPMDQILAQIQAAEERGDKPAALENKSSQVPTAAHDSATTGKGGHAKPSKAAGSSAKKPAKPVNEKAVAVAEIAAQEPPRYYGIYVVQPGDNLWNIHFAFLREYFSSRDIPLPPDADEPFKSQSSGVARILKYAEKMVFIFNIKTRQLSRDLDSLKPLEKIVIFNLSNLNRVLSPLDADNLDRVHFDGHDLLVQETG